MVREGPKYNKIGIFQAALAEFLIFLTDNMKKLILLRHGESTWNKENRFTGWTDVDLSRYRCGRGAECRTAVAGKRICVRCCLHFRIEARDPHLWIVLDELDQMWIPVHLTWRLNERHYGALQGLNKLETALKYGEEQVQIWRRSYNTRPPALTPRIALSGFRSRYGNLSKKIFR